MKLSDARREIGRTNDPKYCLFHRMIHHPTDKCYVLKDRIQSLIDAGVLTLKAEQKKVTANMVTLEFSKTQRSQFLTGLIQSLRHDWKSSILQLKLKIIGVLFP